MYVYIYLYIYIWLNTLDGVEEWAVKKVIILFPHERTLWHIQLSACNQKSMASSSFIWAVIWNNWHKNCLNALLYNINILKGIVCYPGGYDQGSLAIIYTNE